jgi:hypothetical protein
MRELSSEEIDAVSGGTVTATQIVTGTSNTPTQSGTFTQIVSVNGQPPDIKRNTISNAITFRVQQITSFP